MQSYIDMTRKKQRAVSGSSNPPGAGRWRTVHEWVPAMDELQRLSRLVSRHALEGGRAGSMGGCACDLCRFAAVRLEALGAG